MIKQSKHDKQVEQDELDAVVREGERTAIERAAKIKAPPKESLWTKLKRAMGAVP